MTKDSKKLKEPSHWLSFLQSSDFQIQSQHAFDSN